MIQMTSLGTNTFVPQKELHGLYLDILHTGSRVICSPPPTETDDDYLLLVDKAALGPLEDRLKKLGFKPGGSKYYTSNPPELEEFPELGVENKGQLFRSYKADFGKTEPVIRPAFNKADAEMLTWLEGELNFRIEKGYPVSSQKHFKEQIDYYNTLKKSPDVTEVIHVSDIVNIILTCSLDYFSNFAKATRLCASLNLLKKDDRITVFEAVVHDIWP